MREDWLEAKKLRLEKTEGELTEVVKNLKAAEKTVELKEDIYVPKLTSEQQKQLDIMEAQLEVLKEAIEKKKQDYLDNLIWESQTPNTKIRVAHSETFKKPLVPNNVDKPKLPEYEARVGYKKKVETNAIDNDHFKVPVQKVPSKEHKVGENGKFTCKFFMCDYQSSRFSKVEKHKKKQHKNDGSLTRRTG